MPTLRRFCSCWEGDVVCCVRISTLKAYYNEANGLGAGHVRAHRRLSGRPACRFRAASPALGLSRPEWALAGADPGFSRRPTTTGRHPISTDLGSESLARFDLGSVSAWHPGRRCGSGGLDFEIFATRSFSPRRHTHPHSPQAQQSPPMTACFCAWSAFSRIVPRAPPHDRRNARLPGDRFGVHAVAEQRLCAAPSASRNSPAMCLRAA